MEKHAESRSAAQADSTISTRYSLDESGSIIGAESNDCRFGSYLIDQRRFEWDLEALGVDAGLAAWVAEEATLWDDWAETATSGGVVNRQPYALREKHSLTGWLERFPQLSRALEAAGITLDFSDKAILDIGGSGKDLVYWLNEAPARVDQVEVSPRSQALCLSKLKDLGVLDEVPVFFHTVPAEQLPFDDNTYDFVFSRSTLHHCQRPSVLDEVYRVLKPGGTLLFSENYRSDLFYFLMHLDRLIRRRDRGTDDPLRLHHLQYCKAQYARSGTFFSKSVFQSLPFAFSDNPGAGTSLHCCFAGQK